MVLIAVPRGRRSAVVVLNVARRAVEEIVATMVVLVRQNKSVARLDVEMFQNAKLSLNPSTMP